jgi:hypothetical protein
VEVGGGRGEDGFDAAKRRRPRLRDVSEKVGGGRRRGEGRRAERPAENRTDVVFEL